MVKKALTSEKIIEKMEQNKEDIRRFDVRKIGVFGSFAKNKQTKKSDIDILVTFGEDTFDNYTGLLLLLEKVLKRKIDLVIEDDIHPEFRYVKKEARYVRL